MNEDERRKRTKRCNNEEGSVDGCSRLVSFRRGEQRFSKAEPSVLDVALLSKDDSDDDGDDVDDDDDDEDDERR
ncbi:hypothetical protein HZH68_006864 [Vespula germanica]|uniref:Uncharacterized protein n=2 Tax=Vespula TaxID=7451 RepID=A0A834NBN1_VESGE|nr:hypothetical protein HZH68_006864 [Vespula germanica]KAF7427654.1 hypothetical protein H0235_007348 [Vespula pensylvanica]